MTTGFLASGVCWPTSQEATDAFYSSKPITSSGWSDSGDNTYNVYGYVYKSGATWYLQRVYCSLNGGCTANYQTPFAMSNNVYGSCTIPDVVTGGTSASTGLPADFDYSILGAVFAFAVSVVVAMYVLGRGAGVVLSIFRK